MENKINKIALFSTDRKFLHLAQDALANLKQLEVQSLELSFEQVVEQLPKLDSCELIVVQVQSQDINRLERLAKVTPPGCQVVLVGEEVSMRQYRELILLGVADYLTLPIDPTALRNVFTHQLGFERSVSFRQGIVHLVTGTSGGVGASTLAANLAFGLAEKRTVALVDLNTVHSQVPILLGCDYQPNLKELTRNIERIDQLLIEQLSQVKGSHLHLFYGQEDEELNHQDMRRLIEKLSAHFAYVVVDLPSHLIDAFDTLFESADSSILVHDFTLQAGRKFDRVFNRYGKKPHNVHLVGNHSRSNKHKPWNHTQLLDAWDNNNVSELPFDGRAASHSEQTGEPIISGRSKLAKSMAKLKIRLAGEV